MNLFHFPCILFHVPLWFLMKMIQSLNLCSGDYFGFRSNEAAEKKPEKNSFFQSMFGMGHETDIFLTEPQDGAMK